MGERVLWYAPLMVRSLVRLTTYCVHIAKLVIMNILWNVQEVAYREFESACEQSPSCAPLKGLERLKCVRECISPTCYQQLYYRDQVGLHQHIHGENCMSSQQKIVASELRMCDSAHKKLPLQMYYSNLTIYTVKICYCR